MPFKPTAASRPKTAGHVVAFFEHDDFLTEQLAGFVAEGLRRGERAIVIATPTHISNLRAGLRDRGLESAAIPGGSLITLDATSVVDTIVIDGVFVPQRLLELLVPLVSETRCRVFGEMVSVLAQRNQLQCALELEAAGRDLAHRLGVPVLCAYHAEHVAGNNGSEDRAAIEGVHDEVLDEKSLGNVSRTADQGGDMPIVLLADDFDDAREMYAEYLEFAGIGVVTAASGEDAVRLAVERRPDLILMDIRMPGMTGSEAMRRLRQHPEFRQVPILALTAHALHEERARILAQGFDGILTKPCLPDELLAAVRKSLASTAIR